MNSLLRSATKLGAMLNRNKGKLAVALGTIAAAEAMNFLWSRRLRRRLETEERAPSAAPIPPAKRNRGASDKRAIYRAPQLPRQNLARH
ncbi:MAG: hypothetical protein IT572_05675 [Deltaproteobacteria bacterium]|nr:hypothetical protein [Deltaproteobacteria bacterium]